MRRKSTAINAIILLILATIFGGILWATMSAPSLTVSAKNKTELIPYTRESGSGTRGTFISLTGLEELDWLGETKDTTNNDIKAASSSSDMITQIATTKDSIGYVSYAACQDAESVKLLSVDGVKPTFNNIDNESYPLIRAFQLVYTGNATKLEKDFLHYVKSEGQGYVAGYCVPDRDMGIFLPNHAKGELTISGSSSMTDMMELLAKKYMEANPRATIHVKSSDSESGMMDVLSGSSNLGMVSRELKSYEKKLFSYEPIGRDGIAIIVNPNTAKVNISSMQLKRIYNGSVTSWEYLDAVK